MAKTTQGNRLVWIVCLFVLAGCVTDPADPRPTSSAVASGWERAYIVTVFLETDTSSDHEYVVSVVQNGTVVESREAQAMADFPFRTIVMSPRVDAFDALVRIDESGGQLASKNVQPQLCSSGEVAATITAKDSGATITAACN